MTSRRAGKTRPDIVKVALLAALLVIIAVNGYYAGDALRAHAWSIAAVYSFITVVGLGVFVKWKRDL